MSKDLTTEGFLDMMIEHFNKMKIEDVSNLTAALYMNVVQLLTIDKYDEEQTERILDSAQNNVCSIIKGILDKKVVGVSVIRINSSRESEA